MCAVLVRHIRTAHLVTHRASGLRLPTEAEWEKGARGGCELGSDPSRCDKDDLRAYPWGNNEAPSCANSTHQSLGPLPVDAEMLQGYMDRGPGATNSVPIPPSTTCSRTPCTCHG